MVNLQKVFKPLETFRIESLSIFDQCRLKVLYADFWYSFYIIHDLWGNIPQMRKKCIKVSKVVFCYPLTVKRLIYKILFCLPSSDFNF